MNSTVWLDGRSTAFATADAALAALNRGIAYGDGLFETIRVANGVAPLLALHLHRLTRDCARLRIACDFVALEREIEDALRNRLHGVLKIIVVRAGAERGYVARRDAGSHRLLQFFASAQAAPINTSEAAVLRLCRQRLGLQPALAGMKHLNRLEQVLARAEWSDPAISEGLMLDMQGRVIEAVASNIFCVRNGRVATPALLNCGVAGIVRRVVIEFLGIAVDECTLTLDDFYNADEVFITGTQRGIQPVTQLDCASWPIGGVTIALQRKFEALLAQSVPFA